MQKTKGTKTMNQRIKMIKKPQTLSRQTQDHDNNKYLLYFRKVF